MSGERDGAFEETLLRLRDLLLSEWKSVARAMRERDAARSGFVDYATFRSALALHRAFLSDEEFFHLVSYYDKQMTGRVPYNAFIKAFLETA